MRPILFAQEYTLHMFQILAKLTRSFIEGAYLAHSSPNRFLRVFTVFTHLTLILYAHTNS